MNNTSYGEKINQELQSFDVRAVSNRIYGIYVEAGMSKMASSLP